MNAVARIFSAVTPQPIPATARAEFRALLERAIPAELLDVERRTREIREARAEQARRLQALRNELNAKSPNRSKVSDEEMQLAHRLAVLDEQVGECRAELRQVREKCSGALRPIVRDTMRAVSPGLVIVAQAIEEAAGLI